VIPLASRGSCFSRNGGTGRFISRLRASATKTFPALRCGANLSYLFRKVKTEIPGKWNRRYRLRQLPTSTPAPERNPVLGAALSATAVPLPRSNRAKAAQLRQLALIFEQCVCHWGGKSLAHWRTTHCCPFEAFEPRRQWRPLNRAILRPDQVLRILHFHRKRGRGHAASIAASLAEGALLPRDTCPSNFLTSAAPLPWQEAAASSRPKYPA
jgi:hypothetical protein